MNLMTPAQATRFINANAKSNKFNLVFTLHIGDRLDERDLVMRDLLYLLETGFVYDDGKESTQAGIFKYLIEGTTPNSGGRQLAAVVVPFPSGDLKVVTIMWKDEK